MAFDGITIANIVKELQDTLTDSRISKIAQTEPDELLLTLKSAKGQHRLLVSASASLPLIYLTRENKPSPMQAPNFCMLLRKHIGNGRIVSVTQPSMERIIRLEIEHLNELGDPCKKYLIVELMGKHSNIIFCDSNDRIIDSIKHISSQMSSLREVLPGRDYFIVQTTDKYNPLTVTKEQFVHTLTLRPVSLFKALYSSFTGLSPVVSAEICHLSALSPDMLTTELSDTETDHLYRQFTLFMESVSKQLFSPRIYYSRKEPKEFSSLPLTHLSSCEETVFDSVSLLLETYYKTKNTLTRIRQKSVDLRRIVQTALERNYKKYDLQSAQIKDTLGRDKYKIYGELLHTYGYGLAEGADHLEALNYYTNETVVIPLDQTKSAMENAQRYFDRYNKQKRTHEALSQLIVETKNEIDYLESVSTSLDIAGNEEDLIQIREELMQAGYIRRRSSKKKEKIVSRPLHYLSSDGYHIYVGKNNLQNEELTFQFASGKDWWFHAKGCPGSHVIVRTDGDELPDQTFEEAGRLAAYYSKNRGAEKVEIDYVEKKHVKKPNGAKPGFVVYYTNYSLMIDSDISSIQQLS